MSVSSQLTINGYFFLLSTKAPPGLHQWPCHKLDRWHDHPVQGPWWPLAFWLQLFSDLEYLFFSHHSSCYFELLFKLWMLKFGFLHHLFPPGTWEIFGVLFYLATLLFFLVFQACYCGILIGDSLCINCFSIWNSCCHWKCHNQIHIVQYVSQPGDKQ